MNTVLKSNCIVRTKNSQNFPMSSIKIEDLPVGDVDVIQWLDKFIKDRKISKSELTGLSVSLQLIIADLMEQIELLSTQLSSSSVPRVHDAFAEVSKEIATLESELNTLEAPESLKAIELSRRLNNISDLNRARNNIELVKQRLSQ